MFLLSAGCLFVCVLSVGCEFVCVFVCGVCVCLLCLTLLFVYSPPDEIMQQDSSPLCAADIGLDLRKQFAFLSGEFPPVSLSDPSLLPGCARISLRKE